MVFVNAGHNGVRSEAVLMEIKRFIFGLFDECTRHTRSNNPTNLTRLGKVRNARKTREKAPKVAAVVVPALKLASVKKQKPERKKRYGAFRDAGAVDQAGQSKLEAAVKRNMLKGRAPYSTDYQGSMNLRSYYASTSY